jgi:hypothetical protein
MGFEDDLYDVEFRFKFAAHRNESRPRWEISYATYTTIVGTLPQKK